MMRTFVALIAISLFAPRASAQDDAGVAPEAAAAETQPTAQEAAQPAPRPALERTRPAPRRALSAPPTNLAAVMGAIAIVSAVGIVVGVAWWVEREDNLTACALYAAEDPVTRGCLNVPTIRDQRDVGIGLTVGFSILTAAAITAWIISAVTTPSSSASAHLTCGPGPLSFACSGRF